nr:hypothetical protein [Bradyrhizobium sp. WSM3983]
MYKRRHLIENFFCALKSFRRIATRYEETNACFASLIISPRLSSQATGCRQALVDYAPIQLEAANGLKDKLV